jgi:hypothetical protein
MKRVILHIGTPKTGTTSVQWAFKQSRPFLASLGILYPTTGLSADPHEFAHHPLARAARKKIAPPWQALAAEIQASACDTVVLSSEELTALDGKSIEFIREALKGFDLSVVVYLREQVDYIEAMYNQVIKTAKDTRTRDRFLADFLASEAADYLGLLDRWTTNLKPSKTAIRIYQKGSLQNGDIIDDFCELLAVPAERIQRPARKLNSGVNNKYLELLRQVNSLDVAVNEKNPKIVSVLIDLEAAQGSPNPPLFGPDRRALIRRFFEAGNRNLARRFLPDHPAGRSIFELDDGALGELAPEKIEAEHLVPLLVQLLLRA